MVKIAGKEVSQEDLDKFIADKVATEALAKGLEGKVTELETQVSGLGEIDELKKELEETKEIIYKNTLDTRLGQITKYLDTKGRSEDIIKRIGDMSDDDFEFFVDGKTDTQLKTNDEIESAKTNLETEKTEVEKGKDKIIQDYLKGLENDNKTKDDQNLVPKGEIDTEDGTEPETESGFPSVKTVKDIYNLNGSPMFDKTDKMVENAETYLSQYGDKPTVL